MRARNMELLSMVAEPVRVFAVADDGWPIAEYRNPGVARRGCLDLGAPTILRTGVAVALVGRSQVADELWRLPLALPIHQRAIVATSALNFLTLNT